MKTLHQNAALDEKASRAADRSRIVEIEAKIWELTRSIHILQKEADSAQDRLDAYTYPVLTLPPEIVSEIFVHFIPVYPRRAPTNGLGSPLTLAQICRPWREIAFSTPRLWRAVHMSVSSKTTLDEQLNLVESSLARSGSCLLSIQLSSQWYEDHIPLIDLVAPHCERLQHLKLCVFAFTNFHWDSLQRPLLSLRSLTVAGTVAIDRLPTVFLSAPLLNKVALGAYNEYYADWRSILPWSQLSVLTVESIGLDHCALLLALAPKLVFCMFVVISVHIRPNYTPIPPCQFLETLAFRTKFPMELLQGFWERLTLPALRDLQICEVFLGPDPVEGLRVSLSRSQCGPSRICVLDGKKPLKQYRKAMPLVVFSKGRQPPSRKPDELTDIEDLEQLDWGDAGSEDSDPDNEA
ncbi:hypothetical protein B0H16DRAFT_1880327 [Mycena metata]|uniref:F-box domain-containing protein n=1 Tax=Mycena metata TaxID=1033252 RepID=A0AAD7JZN1_9AGAR|nr:hypothetical protein B0H16DRAFT_1880327 [Mycena metata]